MLEKDIIQFHTKYMYSHYLTMLQILQIFQNVANILPQRPENLPVMVFAVTGRNNGDIFFKVGLKIVNDVLVWLKQNNPLYKEALIDQSSLNKLPVNEDINVSVRFIVDCERVPVEENEEEVEVDSC